MSNPNTDSVLLAALAQTLIQTPNTVFAQQGGTYFIEDEYLLSSGATYPCLFLQAGQQLHTRTTYRNYAGTLIALVKYLNRFDLVNMTIDAVRKAINADLNLMKDYVLGNDQLVAGTGLSQARGIPQIALSPYRGELEDIPGVKVVSRTMTCTIEILDYDVP